MPDDTIELRDVVAQLPVSEDASSFGLDTSGALAKRFAKTTRIAFAPFAPVADGQLFLIPGFNLVNPNQAPVFTRIDPNPSTGRYWELPISQDANEYRYYVDFSAVQAGNTQNSVKYAVGTANPQFSDSRNIIFATSVNGIVTPAPGIPLISPEAGGVGRNLIDWGASVDRAPKIERDGAFENVSDPILAGLGFTRVIADRVNGRPFAGDRLDPLSANERLAVRLTVVTDTANNWYTPTLYLFDAIGNVLGGARSLTFEKIHGPRHATFTYSVDTVDARAVSYSLGVENSAGKTAVLITGFQMSRGPGVQWIARGDFPAPDKIGPDPVLAALRRDLHRQKMNGLPRWVFDGDSIIHQNIVASPGYIAAYCVGEIQAALSLDRRIQFVNWLNAARPLGFDGNDAARSGDTSDDLLASLDDALAMNPDVYAFAICANDMINDFNKFTPSYIKNNLQTVVNRAFKSGVKRVVVGTIRPFGTNILDPNIGPHANRLAQLVEINNFIKDTLGTQPNVTVVDLYSYYADPNQPTSVPGYFLPYTNALRDGTHPSEFGAWAYGAWAWLDVIRRLAPKVSAYPPQDMDNLLISAPFSGFGGLKPEGSRVSGSLPNGVRAAMGSGASTVVAVPQSTNFDPYTQREKQVAAFAINPVQSAAVVEQLFVDQPLAVDVRRFKGMWIQAWAEVELQAWPAWGNVSATVNDQTGAVRMVANAAYNVATDRMPNGPLRMRLETMQYLLPADGSIRQMGLAVSFAFFQALAGGAPGYCSLIEWRLGVVDDPRPGLNRATF